MVKIVHFVSGLLLLFAIREINGQEDSFTMRSATRALHRLYLEERDYDQFRQKFIELLQQRESFDVDLSDYFDYLPLDSSLSVDGRLRILSWPARRAAVYKPYHNLIQYRLPTGAVRVAALDNSGEGSLDTSVNYRAVYRLGRSSLYLLGGRSNGAGRGSVDNRLECFRIVELRHDGINIHYNGFPAQTPRGSATLIVRWYQSEQFSSYIGYDRYEQRLQLHYCADSYRFNRRLPIEDFIMRTIYRFDGQRFVEEGESSRSQRQR